MGYSDQSEYPKGIFHDSDLSSVAVEVGSVAGQEVKVAHGIAGSNPATRSLIFRSSDGLTEYFRLTIEANESRLIPGFDAPDGLEVLCSGAATMEVTIFHWTG